MRFAGDDETTTCRLQYSSVRRLTVHLSLLGEYDLASATRRVDSHRLDETLLDVRTPDALAVLRVLLVRAQFTATRLAVGVLLHIDKQTTAVQTSPGLASYVGCAASHCPRLLLSAGACCTALSIDISCPAGAQQQTHSTTLLLSIDRTDRETAGRTDGRSIVT